MRVASASVFIVLACPAAVWAGQAEVDRFLREYPEAARRIQERYAQIRGECHITGAARRANPARFAFDHGFRKVEFFADPNAKGRSGSMVYCLGPDSGFGLRRENDKAPYRVFWLGPASENKRVFDLQFGKYLNAPHSIYWTPLMNLVKPGDIWNMTAEEVARDGETLFKVYYESGEKKEAPNKTWLVLEPNSWVIRSYEVLAGWPPGATRTTKIEVEYDPSGGGIPIPRRVKITDPNLKSEVCEFRNVAFEPTPRAEFSMEFYNLPDIAATPPARPVGLIPWFVGLGVLGLVAGIALKLAAGRTKIRRAAA